jgi:hypothetical protein
MTLHTIELSPSTQIRVSKDTVNEKTFGQVRVWIKKKGESEYTPTRKGVAFSLEKTGELVQGLLNLEDSISAKA